MDFTTLSLADLIGYDFSALDAEGLTAYQGEIARRFDAIQQIRRDGGTPTVAQIEEATQLAAHNKVVTPAVKALEPAGEDALAALDSLSLTDSESQPEPEQEPQAAPEQPAETPAEPVQAPAEQPVQTETPVAPQAEVQPVPVAATSRARVALAGQRPEVMAPRAEDLITITAAAETQFGVGEQISLLDVGEAAIHKLSQLPAPEGDGTTEDLKFFPIANVTVDYPDDLVVDPRKMSTEQIHEVFEHAGDESRLEGESLTASAGWCAPSEILYDLPNNEVVDGILDIPEVQVNRGGFKHTTGIDWSTLYAGVGFMQTEAQAISGTTKTCYEVPCPSFTDERLDAVGLCLKVPILLEAGYPEMVQNITARSMVAHQYKINASVVSRILTSAGAARNFTSDLGSVTVDTLSGLDLVLEDLRQKWRIGKDATIEVVLPVFARSLFRNDLGARNGRDKDAVSDAEIAAHFAVRHANVQYIYGWQELTSGALAWPTTLNFLAYPAGTFVKGVSNVINLQAVYDAASLAVNLYTGLFMEQGLLVAKMNYEAVQGTVPVNIAGRTGAANLT